MDNSGEVLKLRKENFELQKNVDMLYKDTAKVFEEYKILKKQYDGLKETEKDIAAKNNSLMLQKETIERKLVEYERTLQEYEEKLKNAHHELIVVKKSNEQFKRENDNLKSDCAELTNQSQCDKLFAEQLKAKLDEKENSEVVEWNQLLKLKSKVDSLELMLKEKNQEIKECRLESSRHYNLYKSMCKVNTPILKKLLNFGTSLEKCKSLSKSERFTMNWADRKLNSLDACNACKSDSESEILSGEDEENKALPSDSEVAANNSKQSMTKPVDCKNPLELKEVTDDDSDDESDKAFMERLQLFKENCISLPLSPMPATPRASKYLDSPSSGNECLSETEGSRNAASITSCSAKKNLNLENHKTLEDASFVGDGCKNVDVTSNELFEESATEISEHHCPEMCSEDSRVNSSRRTKFLWEKSFVESSYSSSSSVVKFVFMPSISKYKTQFIWKFRKKFEKCNLPFLYYNTYGFSTNLEGVNPAMRFGKNRMNPNEIYFSPNKVRNLVLPNKRPNPSPLEKGVKISKVSCNSDVYTEAHINKVSSITKKRELPFENKPGKRLRELSEINNEKVEAVTNKELQLNARISSQVVKSVSRAKLGGNQAKVLKSLQTRSTKLPQSGAVATKIENRLKPTELISLSDTTKIILERTSMDVDKRKEVERLKRENFIKFVKPELSAEKKKPNSDGKTTSVGSDYLSGSLRKLKRSRIIAPRKTRREEGNTSDSNLNLEVSSSNEEEEEINYVAANSNVKRIAHDVKKDVVPDKLVKIREKLVNREKLESSIELATGIHHTQKSQPKFKGQIMTLRKSVSKNFCNKFPMNNLSSNRKISSDTNMDKIALETKEQKTDDDQEPGFGNEANMENIESTPLSKINDDEKNDCIKEETPTPVIVQEKTEVDQIDDDKNEYQNDFEEYGTQSQTSSRFF